MSDNNNKLISLSLSLSHLEFKHLWKHIFDKTSLQNVTVINYLQRKKKRDHIFKNDPLLRLLATVALFYLAIDIGSG